jgi:glucose-1-phosphate thymidylyltransferase
MEKRGIILAGGSGSRLYPTTLGISKQLINIYDKPLIYYPLCTLMEMGVKDILVISTPQDTGNISRLLGSGHQWGINLSYTVQDKPAGIAQAFILGKHFIGKNSISLILGDNVFTGLNIEQSVLGDSFRSKIYLKTVSNPKAFGVYDAKNKCMVEKPAKPPSNKISTGLYEFPPDVIHYATFLKPSKRGELEIADLINIYLITL